MKKNSLPLLVLVLLLASCGGNTYQKIRLEIPAQTALKLDDFQELVIADFLTERQDKNFDMNNELLNYFTSEFKLRFKGDVVSKRIALEKEETFKEEEFWKALLPERKGVLFLSGKAQFTQETRKAILDKERTMDDDPFSPTKKLSERNVFTLSITLFLIKGETGKALVEKEYKETKSYTNPKQTKDFAFYELIQRIRMKFFRSILGEEKLQERYLISK